jgi:hypothetical protein
MSMNAPVGNFAVCVVYLFNLNYETLGSRGRLARKRFVLISNATLQ